MANNTFRQEETPIDSITPSYPSLLAPFTLAGKRLRNRVMHSSMLTFMSNNSLVTEGMIQYHANRAKGGAALIVTEALAMAPHQTGPNRVRVWNGDNVPMLTRWAEAVEAHDCRLVGQIQDSGRGRHEPGRNAEAVGASPLPDDLSWTMPHVLTIDEVQRMIESFTQGALRLRRCGFSGVELSAGHGHLFHQFMSPWSNNRKDKYGGDLAGRTRFVSELIASLRAACGSDFIIGLKLPGNDWIKGGIDPAEAFVITAHLTAPATVDYVVYAQGAHARSLERHVPDGNGPRVPYRDLMKSFRGALGKVPLVGLGRITDPAEAEGMLARGDCELISMGRTLVADPAWLNKAAAGRAHDIRYCVSCNTCWDNITTRHVPIGCDNNPRVGEPDEVDFWPAPAPVKKRVVVVGTGVAGMEATWVAAARGHNVTTFGRSKEIGGKTRLRSLLPGAEAVSSVYDYQHGAALRAGAKIELGVNATAASVLALKPDVVVMAGGATMVSPPWIPPEVRDAGLVPDLRSAMAPLIGRTRREGGTAVIFDMDHTEGTYSAAELLHTLFDKVVIITPRDSFAQDMALVSRQGVVRRLYEKDMGLIVMSEPRWDDDDIAQGKLAYGNVFTGKGGVIEDVVFLAYSTPRTPEDGMLEQLRAAGVEVKLVGDCRAARGIIAATSEGHAAGNSI